MNSSKRENLLNLALDATEEERLQSLNLNVGYRNPVFLCTSFQLIVPILFHTLLPLIVVLRFRHPAPLRQRKCC